MLLSKCNVITLFYQQKMEMNDAWMILYCVMGMELPGKEMLSDLIVVMAAVFSDMILAIAFRQ